MLYMAEKQPAVFFDTCARLLPNDVRVTVEQSLPGNLSMEDRQMMKEYFNKLRCEANFSFLLLDHVLGCPWEWKLRSTK